MRVLPSPSSPLVYNLRTVGELSKEMASAPHRLAQLLAVRATMGGQLLLWALVSWTSGTSTMVRPCLLYTSDAADDM
eukprot:12243659-Karenia_brevis.AAC.1